MGDKVGVRSKTSNNKRSSIRTIFMLVDRTDIWLMLLGFLGAVGVGFVTPLSMYIGSMLMNNLGGGFTTDLDLFRHKINMVFLLISFPFLSLFLFHFCCSFDLKMSQPI